MLCKSIFRYENDLKRFYYYYCQVAAKTMILFTCNFNSTLCKFRKLVQLKGQNSLLVDLAIFVFSLLMKRP